MPRKKPERLISLIAAGEKMAVSGEAVLRYARAGELRLVNVSAGDRPTWRVYESDVDDYIARRTTA
jgi:predicted site-specific integrase-resolvase